MAGIYISWPFCAQKCTYCNFASGVQPKDLEEQYTVALLAELGTHRWQWTPETLFIGGGTPSNIDPARIEVLLGGLPGKPWLEATIEAAPGSLTVEKVAAWQRAGINRASLGVQSFITGELARTGRKSTTGGDCRAGCGAARSNGIGNINLDLIAGLPGRRWIAGALRSMR